MGDLYDREGEFSRVREQIMECLEAHFKDDNELISSFERIVAETDKKTYSAIFYVLTHLKIAPDRAEECWKHVVSHRDEMNRSLGREVRLMTAVCDYFLSVDRVLRNPKVIEIHIFENQEHSAKYDALTGLYTRGYFDEALIREIARAKRYDSEVSVIFFDLDDFKKKNDCYGHLAGDKILKSVANVIINEVRTEDLAARYGGEEFVIILPQTGKIEALALGERIREKVQSLVIEYEGQELRQTVSGGLASFPIDAVDEAELLRYADKALYSAKDFGKNNVAFYSQNKRRYFRIDFLRDIKVRQIGFTDQSDIFAKGKNLSIAGILFESERAFELGSTLQLDIPIETKAESLFIIGTVVRIELFEDGNYDIGVCFLEMDKGTKNEISKYLIRQITRVYM